MTGKSAIEWTERTWNPLVGCSVLSPGCTNCYAMRTAHRMGSNPKTPQYHGITKVVNGKPVWTGAVVLAKHKLLEPLRRRTPTLYFVNSMSDLFHEAVPEETIDRIFAVMALCPQHTFQILTKRSARMREYMASIDNGDGTRLHGLRDALIEGMAQKIHHEQTGEDPDMWLDVHLPLQNVWLGVSCEDQKRADERIPDLLATPAAIRWVSAEPLLGPIVFDDMFDGHKFYDALRGNWWHDSPGSTGISRGHPKLDWIVVGGESGPDARPMHPEWARQIRDQCAAADVPFFFKQWGSWLPFGQHLTGFGEVHSATAVKPGRMKLYWGGTPTQAPKHVYAEHGVYFASTDDGMLRFRVGKKAAGDLLDGIRHHAWPGSVVPSPLGGEGQGEGALP